MGDIDALVAQSKELLSNLITKPKMTEKLLSKPPFRFLHDTVSAVVKTTGFGEGLMQGDELNSGAITDKAAKMAYLDKIFNFVGLCKVSLRLFRLFWH
jgi:TRAF3-interacting protein 1